jgi:hypothetical protein
LLAGATAGEINTLRKSLEAQRLREERQLATTP